MVMPRPRPSPNLGYAFRIDFNDSDLAGWRALKKFRAYLGQAIFKRLKRASSEKYDGQG
jgi:hypothetical protein